MSLILGSFVKNEERMLALTLPHIDYNELYRCIAVDTGSSDQTIPLLYRYGFHILSVEWKDDFSRACNQVLNMARVFDPDGWLLLLSSDECLMPQSFRAIAKAIEAATTDVFFLPRINLARHQGQMFSEVTPDWQARLFRLSAPFEFRKPVHEELFLRGGTENIAALNLYQELPCPIYHYKWTKPHTANLARDAQYRQIAGQPALVGDDSTEEEFYTALFKRHKFEPFTSPHPLQHKL